MAKADTLVAKGLEIEVEPYNQRHHFRLPNMFIVSVRFVISDSADYIYDPSKSSITTQAGRTVFARGAKNVVFYAGAEKSNSFKGDFLTRPYELDGRRDSAGTRRERITLFFDVPAISEGFTLTIDGLTKNGMAISVPTLMYSAEVR